MEGFGYLVEASEKIGDGPFKAAMVMVLYFGFRHGVKELRLLRESVSKLHEAIGLVVERVSGHETRITNLERKRK